MRAEDRQALAERTLVVLHEPQDLVNVALVTRAMKNIGLRRLCVVRPAEPFDPWRIEGIAHDTADVVERAEVHTDLDPAIADAAWVLGTSARRRATRQRWLTPEEAAPEILARARHAPVALLFGREDRGLSNEDLDRCHAVVSIPTDPEHPSMNLAHAALILFYELRKAATREAGEQGIEIAPKRRWRTSPATAGELERLFDVWERAMQEVGLFHGIDPLPKMRSFRGIFQRADLDSRELKLLQAAAWEVLHYVRRERARLRAEEEEPG